MKRCKLVIGQMWGEKDINQTVNIPDDVYFYDLNTIGHGSKVGCNYYGTVIKTNDYKEWIKYLTKRNLWGWGIDELGEYTIITIRIVYEDKHTLPIKTMDEVLKDIDFSKYVFAYYDKNYRCVNIRRIFKFRSSLSIDAGFVTLRDFFSTNEMLRIQTDTVELTNMQPTYCDCIYSKYKMFEGEEAETIWNSAINKVISTNFNYNASKVDKDYKFSHEYDLWMEKHDKTLTEYLEDIKFENIKQLDQVKEELQDAVDFYKAI